MCFFGAFLGCPERPGPRFRCSRLVREQDSRSSMPSGEKTLFGRKNDPKRPRYHLRAPPPGNRLRRNGRLRAAVPTYFQPLAERPFVAVRIAEGGSWGGPGGGGSPPPGIFFGEGVTLTHRVRSPTSVSASICKQVGNHHQRV